MDSTWCDLGQHTLFDFLTDFNDWLEGEEEQAESKRAELQLEQFSSPSKALFAGDKAAYLDALAEYRLQFMQKVMSSEWLTEVCGDNHWYEKNQSRFLQLLNLLEKKEVLPFVGAGLSVAGGFPTWKAHLKAQGRTAGLNGNQVDQQINNGEYEQVIQQIEQQGFLDAFQQELVDSFEHVAVVPDSTRLIATLFSDTVITTNYDRLIEYTYQNEFARNVEIIDNRDPNKLRTAEAVSVVKLHGDISTPQHCIMSHNHYNQAYGNGEIDLTLPVPKFLEQTFISTSLLFLGCSLNNDRTIQVFKYIKTSASAKGETLPKHFSIEQAPETEQGIIDRNNELLKLGITPIWFQPTQFDTITEILRYAIHEMNYRKAMTE